MMSRGSEWSGVEWSAVCSLVACSPFEVQAATDRLEWSSVLLLRLLIRSIPLTWLDWPAAATRFTRVEHRTRAAADHTHPCACTHVRTDPPAHSSTRDRRVGREKKTNEIPKRLYR